MRRFLIAISFLLSFLLLTCQEQTDSETNQSPRVVAQQYCSSCHVFPEPDALDKATWQEYMLPRMGYRLGIYPEGFDRTSLLEAGLAGEVVEAANIYPKEPLLSQDDWAVIEKYYLDNAPEQLVLADIPKQDIDESIQARFAPYFTSPPSTSLLRYTSSNLLAVGQADKNAVLLLDNQLNILTSLPVQTGPVDLEESATGIYITCMGSFSPTDASTGSIVYYDFQQQQNPVLIDKLQRPVQTELVDLNGDDRYDLVICEFGKWTGRLAWWEQLPDGSFTPHSLMVRPGAIAALSRDLDTDGDQDLVVLFGQGDEGIWAFYNDGQGQFESKNLMRFPSTYGSSFLQWTDWNGDEIPDLLYCAGDNADYRPIVKPYHGIRVFQGKSDGSFEEVLFYALPGAYAARIVDADQDGDKDIAAISFFPDFPNTPYRSFVYLENDGNGNWQEKHIPQAAGGRWIVMDSGDPNQDGQLDLVLGSLAFEVIPDNGEVDQWVKNGLPFLELNFAD